MLSQLLTCLLSLSLFHLCPYSDLLCERMCVCERMICVKGCLTLSQHITVQVYNTDMHHLCIP